MPWRFGTEETIEREAYSLTPYPINSSCEEEIWESIVNFKQLQAAMALTVQGNIQESYMHPRLDKESEWILNELTDLNLAGFITTNSQAYEEGQELNSTTRYRSKPWLTGMFDNDKSKILCQKMAEKYSELFIILGVSEKVINDDRTSFKEILYYSQIDQTKLYTDAQFKKITDKEWEDSQLHPIKYYIDLKWDLELPPNYDTSILPDFVMIYSTEFNNDIYNKLLETVREVNTM